jgi:hypothetical protein
MASRAIEITELANMSARPRKCYTLICFIVDKKG